MGVYLEDHPPARRQYYNPRRAQATGAIVVHTAESATDLVLPDGGAEGVAAFISRRSDPGSYHSVVDSDSIVKVGRYEWEMFGEGTGGNRWALHLSFACQAAQWPFLPGSWWEEAIWRGGIEAADMARWMRATRGIEVPARRITAAEYRAGRPGFISHAELDPGRRSDPGTAFPWDRFLINFTQALDIAPPTGGAPVADSHIAQWQQHLIGRGYDLGPTGADGTFGPATLAVSLDWSGWIDTLNARIAELTRERDALAIQVDDLRTDVPDAAARITGQEGLVGSDVVDVAELRDRLARIAAIATE